MTREEILAMEVGKELDSLVAEKVMGWEIRRIYNSDDSFHEYYYRNGEKYENINYPNHWQPSKFIESAWEVVEKMRENDYGFALSTEDEDWSAWFMEPYNSRHKDKGRVEAKTAPEAICKAALLAMEEK